MLIGAMRIALSPFNMRKRAVGEGVEPRSGCIAVWDAYHRQGGSWGGSLDEQHVTFMATHLR